MTIRSEYVATTVIDGDYEKFKDQYWYAIDDENYIVFLNTLNTIIGVGIFFGSSPEDDETIYDAVEEVSKRVRKHSSIFYDNPSEN